MRYLLLALFLVSPAAADITDSGGMVLGSGLVVTSGTFTASGATQYSIETSSGIKIDAGCIVFPDATMQCTKSSGGGGGGGSTIVSTTTWFTPGFSYTTTQTAFNQCVPGSTVTFTTHGGVITVIFSGNPRQDNTSQDMNASFMLDGKIVGPDNLGGAGSYSLASNKPAFTGSYFSMNFIYPIRGSVSAASHAFCLALRTGGSGPTLTFESHPLSAFTVREEY